MSKAEWKKFKEQILRVQMNRISNEQQKSLLISYTKKQE